MTEATVKPSREEHKVRLTDHLVEIARALASRQNRAFADVLYEAVEIGLDVLVERDNRVNIWRKTSAKAEIVRLIESMPQERIDEAIAKLRELRDISDS